MSPVQLLLYSSDTLKRIKKIIDNKRAYLVTSFPSSDDPKLSY